MLSRLLIALSLALALSVPMPAAAQNVGSLPSATSPGPATIIPCATASVAGSTKGCTASQVVHAGGGDGELGNYAPVDPASTNYLFQSNALGTSPWTATNVTVAQSALIGTSNIGTAWDLTSTSTGGFIQQITPLASIPADTRTYVFSIYFDRTRTTTPWTINFFFTGGPTNALTYTPGTDTISACTGGGTCGRQFVGNKVRLWIAAANAGYTRATVKILPTGGAGSLGTSTVDNVQLEAATGSTQLTGPTCINKTTSSAIARTGVCGQSGASLTADQTFSGANTFTGNLIFTRYPTSGNPTCLLGGPTSPESPNNSFCETNCKVEVSGVCAIVPYQSNQWATVAARQPDLIGWRGSCATDGTLGSDGRYLIVDYSTCAVRNGDAILLLQGSAAEGYHTFSKSVTAAVVSAAGSGYTAGDVLTVSGGTVSTREGTNGVAAKITVDTVSAGAVATYHVSNIGAYVNDIGFALPTNPVAVTGGTGTGATFTLTFANHANATVGNLMLQADTACGAIGAWSAGGRWKFGIENPALGVAPNAMFYVLDLRCNGATFGVQINAPASTTAAASLNLAPGVAPTSPANGDVWLTSSGLYARAGGATMGPFGAGGGTVTSTSVTTANGVSGSVANPTTTPAITLTLGAITPSSVAATGTVAGSNLSGTNTGDQTSVSGNAGTATALQTPRAINGVNFDGTAAITINAVDATARVPTTRTISTTAPLAGGGDLSADRTLSITAATTGAAGSMSAADKTKLDGLATVATSGSASDLTTGTLPVARTPAFTGDVTKSSGSGATTIASAAVTYAKIQNVAASSLLGNPTGSAAAPSEITLGSSFTLSGSTLYGAVDHPGYVSTRWYNAMFGATVASGSAITGGQIRLNPFIVSKPITPTDLALRVTTLFSGGNVQAAIYANNAATERPTGNAICTSASMSTTTAVTVSGTATCSSGLAPGLYWAGINSDNSTAAFQSVASSEAWASALIGSTTLTNVSSGATATAYSLSVTQSFGTWPDLTSASFTEVIASGVSPVLYMKAQ